MTPALKEWAVVCEALGAGRQVLSLRKGGIEEEGGVFQPRHRAFYLFPTFEHQHLAALRPDGQAVFKKIQEQNEKSEKIVIKYWVEASAWREVKTLEDARRFAAQTVWTDAAMTERFQSYPGKPMFVLFLRTFRLNEPLRIPNDPSYAGCRSWVPLAHGAPPAQNQMAPVLPAEEFERRCWSPGGL
jgi:hypothetical protein